MQLSAVVLIAVLASAPALAQGSKSRCTGDPPDSVALAQGPAYRDCDVDRPAALTGSPVRPDFSPPSSARGDGRCYTAEFQFVVDTLGRAELGTVRRRASNNIEFAQALEPTISQLRYVPARLGERAVRQVVLYKQSVTTRVVVTTSPGPPSSGAGRDRRPLGC